MNYYLIFTLHFKVVINKLYFSSQLFHETKKRYKLKSFGEKLAYIHFLFIDFCRKMSHLFFLTLT